MIFFVVVKMFFTVGTLLFLFKILPLKSPSFYIVFVLKLILKNSQAGEFSGVKRPKIPENHQLSEYSVFFGFSFGISREISSVFSASVLIGKPIAQTETAFP